jgi:radical SAM-linked protein
MAQQRVRIRFRKQDDLRLISHRDLARTWERLFRRAGLQMAMSEGFHPKPKMNFPSALAVGIVGADEVLELDLDEERTADQLQQLLSAQTPPGMVVESVEVRPAGSPKAHVQRITFALDIPADRQKELAGRITTWLATKSHLVEREKRKTPLDVRPFVEDLSLVDGVLSMRLKVNPEGSARPREVLEALGLIDLESQGLCLTRTSVELQSDEDNKLTERTTAARPIESERSESPPERARDHKETT